jgi:hypothetical protein
VIWWRASARGSGAGTGSASREPARPGQGDAPSRLCLVGDDGTRVLVRLAADRTEGQPGELVAVDLARGHAVANEAGPLRSGIAAEQGMRAVAVRLPEELLARLDALTPASRSDHIRRAILEYLERCGG